jgi:hypothetical protein
MRVLALAALDVPYIRDNWMDAVAHVLGGQAVVVNVTPLVACGGRGAHVRYVNRLAAMNRFDYLFLYHDYIFADFDDDFFGYLRGAGLRTAAFHPDDEGETWYQRNRVFDARYDLVATHSRAAAERRCRENRPTRPLYLPWGFNPRFFAPPASAGRPTCDVVFVGKYKTHEHDTGRFTEDGRPRDELLCRVADHCTRRGRVFKVFGHGWERHPRLAPFAGGLLTHADMVDVFQTARIVLNPGWSADEVRPVPQTKLRHFEVAGCGGFQLTNENAELAELFEPDREMAFFSTADDLCDRIDRFLEDDDARERIAAAGCRRAHAEHTLDHRVRTLFGRLQELWPPRPPSSGAPSKPPRVHQVDLRTRTDVERLYEDVAARRRTWPAGDGVHVRLVDGQVVRSDYGGLEGFWHAEGDVLGVRTFYDTATERKNPLQPRRHEVLGGMLGPSARLDRIPFEWRSEVTARFGASVDGDRAHLLINHVARAHAVEPLLAAFLSSDPSAPGRLGTVPTGLVVSEVVLPLDGEDRRRLEPAFAAPLGRILDQAVALGHSVALYGARGELAEGALDLVRRHGRTRLVGIVDRAMAGTELAGVPVVGFFDLPALAPDVVIVAAAYSGPAIVEQLRPLEPRLTIVPLLQP